MWGHGFDTYITAINKQICDRIRHMQDLYAVKWTGDKKNGKVSDAIVHWVEHLPCK